jgi:hypothetical protein
MSGDFGFEMRDDLMQQNGLKLLAVERKWRAEILSTQAQSSIALLTYRDGVFGTFDPLAVEPPTAGRLDEQTCARADIQNRPGR